MELNLPDPKKVTRLTWKNRVKDAVGKANSSYLLDLIKNKYEKLNYESLKEENFEMKEYVTKMSLQDARTKFAIRSKMVKTVKFNYSSDPKHSSQLWHCSHCEKMDSQSHILVCDSYQYLREGKDLKCDKDLVKYFRDVISLREKIQDVD